MGKRSDDGLIHREVENSGETWDNVHSPSMPNGLW